MVILVALNVSTGGMSNLEAGRREDDLLDRLLAAESGLDTVCPPADGGRSVQARIEALAAKARPLLEGAAFGSPSPDKGSPAARRVEVLNRLVFGDLAIRPTQDLKEPANLLLRCVLESRRGYCVGIASLYLALAERLDLPIFPVATPSHVFLRYDDGATRINIETFQGGASIPDEQYVREHRIPGKSIRRGVFMRNLTADEFLAQVHNNLGVIHSERREYDEAAEEYGRANGLYPRFPAVYYNYGNDLLARGQHRKAVRMYSRALRQFSLDVWTLNNRGLAYRKLGKRDKARRDFGEALRIDPEFEAARRNLDDLEAPATPR